MEYEGYPIVNERLIPESELRDKAARIAELEAENERLQQIIRTITSWPEMESYRQAISGLLEGAE